MYIECRHIFPSGKKCASPSLSQQDFCYFHHNKRNQKLPSRKSGEPSTLTHHLPQLEDPDTILTALSDVILALGANRIDPRRAQILIYGLQVASQHSRHVYHPSSLETVRDAYEDEDGALVGPRRQRYDTADIVINEDDEEDEEDKHLREIEERWEREIEEQYGPKKPSSEQPSNQEPSSAPTNSTPDQSGCLSDLQATAEPLKTKRQCRRANLVIPTRAEACPERSRRGPAVGNGSRETGISSRHNLCKRKANVGKKEQTFPRSTEAPLQPPDAPIPISQFRTYAQKQIIKSFGNNHPERKRSSATSKYPRYT
jgi:hypothetical protein